jgi:hypothetical protein
MFFMNPMALLPPVYGTHSCVPLALSAEFSNVTVKGINTAGYVRQD